jgi:hypothetical protein
MGKKAYHPQAIHKGRPMFGPSDVGTGSYQRWLEARQKAGDPGVEDFHALMLKTAKAWNANTKGDRGSSGQRALMLDTFEFPEVVERLMRSEP